MPSPTAERKERAGSSLPAVSEEEDFDKEPKPLSTVARSDYPRLKPEKEVLYSKGATDLFLAIEDCRWRDALDIAEDRPEEIPIWVKSGGMTDSPMDISCWRRLPMHEACRRQAPAWLISTLLAAHPESAQKTTQFDQLPLHIAVEFGAAPEVVNLLVVAYWDAIVALDQSGRTPMELLNTSELLQQEEYRVVFDSLSRCHAAYTNFEKSAKDQQNAIKRKHKVTFAAVSKKHSEELKRERDVQEDLRKQLQTMTETVGAMQHEIKQSSTIIEELQEWKHAARAKEDRMTARIEELSQSLAKEKKQVAKLTKSIEKKDSQIVQYDDRVQLLSGDLQAVLLMQEQDVSGQLMDTERAMRAMVSSQIALQKQLLSQSDSLRGLLEERGIPILSALEMPDFHQPPQEEKESSLNAEVDPEQQAAVVAAAAAALGGPMSC